MSSERVVVLMKDFLGDAVLATPLIDGLLAQDRQVCLCTSDGIFKMLAAPFRKLEFIPIDKSRSISASTRFARRMRAGKFDVAIIVNRSFRSALTARMAGIGIRCGHNSERRGMLLTHSIPYDLKKSESECYLDLGRALGFNLPSIEPKLVPTEEERYKGRALLDGAVFGVQAGATWDLKRLSLPMLAELIRRLGDRGVRTALIGGSDELETAAKLKGLLTTPVVDLVGKTNLRGTMGVVANLHAAVGGDTGLMHIAAATGCPTISVFGPKPGSKWGHYYAPHQVLEAPGHVTSNLTLEMLWPAIENALSALNHK